MTILAPAGYVLGARTVLVLRDDGAVVLRLDFPNVDAALDEIVGHLDADGGLVATAGEKIRGLVYPIVGPKGLRRWVYRGRQSGAGPVWEAA